MLLKTLEKLLDILFPPKETVRRLHEMTASEFAESATRSPEPPGKHTVALFDYRDPLVHDAIWELKYRGDRKIARLLAAMLYDEMLGFLGETFAFRGKGLPLLIPIPLSKKRERERGFNQCALLAEELARFDAGRSFTARTGILIKMRDTKSQTETKGKEEREENLAGCFAVARPEEMRSARIMLLDDVTTTGTTLKEARRALRSAGAREVIAFAVAH